AFAFVDHARQNGVDTYFSTEVTQIGKHEDNYFVIHIENPQNHKGRVKGKYVVNAAGLYADQIACMIGDDYIDLNLQRGSYVIFDKEVSSLINNMVYVGGLDPAYSQVIGPTVHGNLILGMGHFVEPSSKEDTEVTKDVLDEIIKMGYQISPYLEKDKIITAFSGIKSTNTVNPKDFYIDYSQSDKNCIHAVICSPGVTAAPGISEYITELLHNAGLNLKEKKIYSTYRKPVKKFNITDKRRVEELIKKDPAYGSIVCRCENVCRAEIEIAIEKGAVTLDGIKHVTRAGMGRCQGGFCSSWIISRLARYYNNNVDKVTKKGKGSEIVIEEL
ncbi:MAG: FAD-dependent oxidoreductase, partial [Spirochaetaceae bacterium]